MNLQNFYGWRHTYWDLLGIFGRGVNSPYVLTPPTNFYPMFIKQWLFEISTHIIHHIRHLSRLYCGKIGWNFGPKPLLGSPPPRKRRENLKQPFLGHFCSKWAGFLHETLLSHTLLGKLVASHLPAHPPTHPSGLPPARPPLIKSCLIRLIFAGVVDSPITWLHMKYYP